MPAKLYVLVYRTGGTVNFRWHRSLSFRSLDEANVAAQENRRMGYRTYVEDYGRSLSIGLPETYGPEGV